MALNVKNESFEESSNIVDVSSDDEDMVSPKIDIPIIKHPERPGTPDTHCSICLEELNNKCYSDSCWHMFCFECLKRWSTIESSCPLCKKSFKMIHHSLTIQGLHETYEVPLQERDIISPRIFLRPFGEISDVNRLFRMNLFLDIVRRNERLLNDMNHLGNMDHNHNASLRDSRIIEGLNIINSPRSFEIQNNYLGHRETVFVSVMRTRVYIENVWADPLPDLSGRFRDCTSAFFRENPAQTHRLQRFIIRDVAAIRSVDTDLIDIATPEGIITNLILQSILNFDIRDANMATILVPYLGEHTTHFCHELYNFANSPYDMVGYDRNVRYSVRHNGYTPYYQSEINAASTFGPTPVSIDLDLVPEPLNQNETIVLDSDDELEEILPTYEGETIVLSSSSDIDSEVEIINASIVTHTIEDSDSSRDQPSTSTGIRDSQDRPNNRYNLRRRRPATPLPSLPDFHINNHAHNGLSYQSTRRGGRIIVDSSTDDEDTIISSQPVHTKNVVCGRRKRKIKKNKMRKKKRQTLDESQPETHFGLRNRSYSDSSTSSSDIDTTRSNNNNYVSIHTNVA